jgi:acyl-CoA thioester hydrolase
MRENWTEIRVIYAHTDQMMGVHHSRFFEYFEIARTEMLRKVGYTYKEFEEAGFMLPLVEAHVNFKYQAKYDDVLRIRSYIDGDARITLKISYEVYNNKDDKLICDGYTKHAFVKSKTFRATRAPEIFLKLFK